MDIQTFSQRFRRISDSHTFMRVLKGIIILLCVLAVFEFGVLFGMHEERHSYRWGENYAQNFGGPHEGFIPHPGQSPNGHGAFGLIATTTLPTFIITDPNHPEETIRISSSTVIKNGPVTSSANALTKGTYVVVLGSPNTDGIIDASLIRIMPAPQQITR